MNLWSLGYKKLTCRDHFNCICHKLRSMDKYDYRCSNNIKHFFCGLDNIYGKDSTKRPYTTTIFNQLCEQILYSSKFSLYGKKLYIAMFTVSFHALLCRSEIMVHKLWSLPVDLSAPIALLRLLALVTLSHDMVHVYGAGDVVCQQLLPGL